jgi:hypothetical protein
VALAERFTPFRTAPAAEKRIAAVDPRMHQSEVDARRKLEAQPVNLRAADHHHGRLCAGRDSRRIERGHDDAAARREIVRTAQHEIGAPRQCAADRLIGLAAHEHVLAESERFEAGEIRGQPPRQLIAASDDIVFRRRDDQFHADLYAGGI